MNDRDYEFLKSKIYKLTKIDINCYKSQQMRRRLEAYLVKHNSSVGDFCSMLEKSQEKQRELLDYVAINVSEFFRDASRFEILYKTVLPELLAKHRRLNIWSAACSCGQEPYSLAMLLDRLSSGTHRILATDIDQSALTQARNGGPYLPYEIRNVEKYYLDRYFTQNNAGFWIKDEIKRKIIFQRHNLLSDPFEINYDLIVCRNVIIYFSEIVRDNLYRKFHDSLKTEGVLFLGGSEVVLRPAEQGFSMINPAFYRKMALDSGNNRVLVSGAR
ncbi:MAG: protein-glutamate O-methyltransferase CheR [Dehalococcoidales bacterium]|nr:protein-glutamate O-methyltransferase CheR [Dehalococcoidales bacterium]